jgi:outer membrane protein TolC
MILVRSSLFRGLFSVFFYNLSTIRLAEAGREYSRAKKKQMELQVIEDITNSHSNVAVSREALHYTQDFLKAAEQEYTVALAQYKAGTTDILRVISAQTSLATARSQRANALQNWFVSLSTLAYAAGVIQRDPRSFLQESSQ